MLVFHEGLPGAGKSYEAIVFHILPSIKAGRNVITNIEGVNNAKLAELSGIPERFVDEMVDCCDFADVSDVEERVKLQREYIVANAKNDSLVVIDEIQDLFPTGRQKLPPDQQKFFTEHRHEGQDIILMGQDFRDCHNIIRRRVKRKIVFTQLTALGQSKRYRWSANEATTAEKFKEITTGIRSYEKKYFGSYASHTKKTKNTNVYADKRTNIFHTPLFKWGIPICLAMGYFSINHLVGFFTDPSAISSENTVSSVSSAPKVQQASLVTSQQRSAPKQVSTASLKTPLKTQSNQSQEDNQEPQPIDVFDQDVRRWRPRLSGVIESEDGRLYARVEVLDKTLHTKDIYSLEALHALGWSTSLTPAGLTVEKEGVRHLIRPWPIDPFGRASRRVRSSI